MPLAAATWSNAAGQPNDFKAIYQARVENCAGEAVRWSLSDGNMSEPIVVDNTGKFHHLRVDGYARHWDERVWAFVSAPADGQTGSSALTFGYVDPANGPTSPNNAEKRAGMREVLQRCLRNQWPDRAASLR